MPNIARISISNPLYIWMLMLVCFFGGIHGIQNVSRLEDPVFPMGWAYVITPYPGASAEEVELEVTDRVEAALQELPYIEHITSKSVPGRSEIQVELYSQYGEGETEQIFDELRRRVSEAQARLPPAAGTPLVEDDFGDIYGVMYAVTAPGYSEAEIHDMAREISTRIKQIPNVAKINIRGQPFEAVFIELEHALLTNLGLSIDDLGWRIRSENQVVPAGSAMLEGRRLRIAQPTPLASVNELKNLQIGLPGSTQVVELSDIAAVTRHVIEAPIEMIRFNGEEAFIVSVSVTPGENVVPTGHAVDALLEEIEQNLPLGVSIQPIYRQHTIVEEATDTFLRNLAISIGTVVLALFLFMGWRPGIVVGLVLMLTVLGTIEVMNVFQIEMQRISLGAMMIAMGMLVDNGIVVAEAMLIGVRRGQAPADAAANAVSRTQYALLGATIIGILSFAPISLSDDHSGHFLISLFQVISVSLLLSWVLAITIIPLIGSYLFKQGGAATESELYSAWYFKPYEILIRFGLRRAWLTSLIIAAITAVALYSMQFVKTAFFPATNTPMYFVDFRLPEGTDIRTTAAELEAMEGFLLDRPGIASVTSFIGRSSPRFAATADVQQPNPAYAQMMIQVEDLAMMVQHMQATEEAFQKLNPDAEIFLKRHEFSPSGDAKIQARFSGPDSKVLRELAEQAQQIYYEHRLLAIRTDWRLQSLQLSPVFNDDNARRAGVSRNDLARALAFNTHGIQIGLMRDGDKLLPIVARAPDSERANLSGLMNRKIWSPNQRQYVPISQIVSAFNLESGNTTIYRRDRLKTLSVDAAPPAGTNTNRQFNLIRPRIEAIDLPDGYSLEWGGEYEANQLANEELVSKFPLAFSLMFFITVLMFGAIRQAIAIWLTVPMILCGVSLGLIITGLPLTFTTMLGIFSLVGMLIKNCIILVDEIDYRLATGDKNIHTMMMASISRLRPVALAALTTIFGMSPLLTDNFFRSMAVSIMSGLAFATLLTLVAVPVFYRILLGKRQVSD